ncbi:MAG: T9SS type A sorting domain-containing protein [Crocinitomicaceae bacterium]
MKKIYMIIAAVAVSFGATAQDDFAANLISPTSGSTSSDDPVTISFEVENVGSTTMPSGDTLWLSVLIDGGIFGLDIAPGGVTGYILEADLAPGDVFTVPDFGIDWLPQASPTSVEVCVAVWGNGIASFSGDGETFEDIVQNDEDVTNNTDCFTAELPVEVDDASIEEAGLSLTNVYVAAGDLLIVNEGNNPNAQANLNIYNINGQVVQNENFVITQGTNTIGLDNLTAGIYIVAIEVEGAVVTRKISIQ